MLDTHLQQLEIKLSSINIVSWLTYDFSSSPAVRRFWHSAKDHHFDTEFENRTILILSITSFRNTRVRSSRNSAKCSLRAEKASSLISLNLISLNKGVLWKSWVANEWDSQQRKNVVVHGSRSRKHTCQNIDLISAVKVYNCGNWENHHNYRDSFECEPVWTHEALSSLIAWRQRE